MKKQKLEKLQKEVLEMTKARIANALISSAHIFYLKNSKIYRTAFAKQLGISEKLFIKIANGQYNGKLSSLVAICLRNGLAPIMELRKPTTFYKKKVKKLSKAEKDKIEYVRLALGLSGFNVSDKAAELIWRVTERLKVKKGNFDLKDAGEIEIAVTGGRSWDIKLTTEEKSKK